MTTSTTLAAVTVVFDAEVELLVLQARSFARHVAPGVLGEVLVVDNTRRGLGAADRERLTRAYGPVHADALAFVRPEQLGMRRQGSGWRRQQALKLLAARRLTAEHYVVLDAKNHAVAPLAVGHVVAADGRPRIPVHGYRNHPLRRELERVLAYTGLDPADHLDRFTATIPPFTMRTATTRALLDEVERDAGRPFGAELVARELTEFFLSTAVQLRSAAGLDEVVDALPAASPTVWPSDLTAERVARVAGLSDERGTPFFAVHRRALAAMEPAAVDVLTRFWVARGLFDDVAGAEEFVARARRQVQRESRVQRVVDVPPKAAARLRRLTRKAG